MHKSLQIQSERKVYEKIYMTCMIPSHQFTTLSVLRLPSSITLSLPNYPHHLTLLSVLLRHHPSSTHQSILLHYRFFFHYPLHITHHIKHQTLRIAASQQRLNLTAEIRRSCVLSKQLAHAVIEHLLTINYEYYSKCRGQG